MRSHYSKYIIIIFLYLTSNSLFSQGVYLEDENAAFANYTIIDNSFSDGRGFSIGGSVLGKFDFAIQYTDFYDEDVFDSVLGYLSINHRDKRIPWKSIGSFSLGLIGIGEFTGGFVGLGYYHFLTIGKQTSLVPDIGGGFVFLNVGILHVESELKFGCCLELHKKHFHGLIRPGVSISKETTSYLLTLGIMYANLHEKK